MKIYPVRQKKEEKEDFSSLTPLEKKTRKAALLLVLVGVFVWFFKILFF
ncbi:hypothetical protein [Dyadobacter sandarakinus]|uniref:Uncharacterized protein n=1 Tax=Dyadobacter sandarakinus TaxID=2747268 RepID=A0ABX7I2V7_9BACT|nr:hypothetical protein [Dyadobacter sandarakinus]QRQ99567.1 hypothetical protein HWI92_00875 [Dyadobacter sandarakinus]